MFTASLSSIFATTSHFFTTSPAFTFTSVTVHIILKLSCCSSTSSTFPTTSIVSFTVQLETIIVSF
ncbi:MAG: hypothetical protein LBQ24_06555 [Candidatus Peribacteria bacterium]|nr:hypothetical protein [Candidatus Peribacteria bacterium]